MKYIFTLAAFLLFSLAGGNAQQSDWRKQAERKVSPIDGSKSEPSAQTQQRQAKLQQATLSATSQKAPSGGIARMSAGNGQLRVSGLTVGEPVSIFNATGALVYHRIAASEETDVPLTVHGVYIVRSGGNVVRVAFVK